MIKKEVIIGDTYRHYKKGEYIVRAIAKHSETLEEMVVYQNVNAKKMDEDVWARPLSMFVENVILPDGTNRPRFDNITRHG
ncbi:MAG: DUF1653 domain-containing protein [Candidatus Paceibacterota bacterium]